MTALPKTMKAAVTHEANDIRMEEVPLPDHEPDDVLVRVEMCGICGTDLHILSGHMRPLWPPHYPFIQGHEWCGTVAALGRNVKRDLKVGDRVIAEPTIGCGQCARCIRGDYHICEAAGKDIEGGYRLLGHTFNGAFSEYGVAPPNNLHRIPDSMSWQEGVIVNQVVIAMHALDRGGRVEPTDKVAITGPGLLGLCVLELAKHYGASKTYITGRGPRLEVAKELGGGLFFLVKTSNPGADLFQDHGDPPLAEKVACQVAAWGKGLAGASGWSSVGAVVGATRPEELARFRELMPDTPLLLPGFGFQGGSADGLGAAFSSDGLGALVSASRSILWAHEREDLAHLPDWEQQVDAALGEMVEQVRPLCGSGQ